MRQGTSTLTNTCNNNSKRLVFITDMNSVNETEFINLITESANEGIYTTIIGVGQNFDTQLSEIVAKNRGFNYFSAWKKSIYRSI